MRRLFLVASVTTIAAAVVHCSHPTELVVAVDTDLLAGTDVDEIEVVVEGPTGIVFDKKADVLSQAALPLTLGVAAGSTDDAEVRVIATATKSGTAVARTEVVARFVPGESRFVQVSICKSCGLTCGRNLGSSLPEWNDSLPPKNACDTTFADAGNFDSGRPPIDGGGGSDGNGDDGGTIGVDGGDGGGGTCTIACPEGTKCQGGTTCTVTRGTSCSAPIVVSGSVTLVGTLCGDAGTADFGTCVDAGSSPAAIVSISASATGTYTSSLHAFGGALIHRTVSTGSCVAVQSSNCAVAPNGGGGAGQGGIAPGDSIGIGLSDKSPTACADYNLKVTKQ